MALAQGCGLGDLVGRHVVIGRPCGVNADLKVGCLVAGTDSIDDTDVLRHGAMALLSGGVRAPPALGTFLRSPARRCAASARGVASLIIEAVGAARDTRCHG